MEITLTAKGQGITVQEGEKMGEPKRYTVTIRSFGSDRERSFRVRADSEAGARNRAAVKMFGNRAYFRGDLPGVPHVGQLWWREPMGRFGAIEPSSALTGRVFARVEEGW